MVRYDIFLIENKLLKSVVFISSKLRKKNYTQFKNSVAILRIFIYMYDYVFGFIFFVSSVYFLTFIENETGYGI